MGYLLGLGCDSSIKLNNAVFYDFVHVGVHFLSALISDNFGRKTTFLVATVLGLVGGCVSLMKLDYTTIVIGGTFKCYVAKRLDSKSNSRYNWFYSNVYTYMAEIMGGRLRVIFTSSAYASNSMTRVVVNVLSIWFNHYTFYVYFCIVSIAVCSVSDFYFLESPFYFYKQIISSNFTCVWSECASASFLQRSSRWPGQSCSRNSSIARTWSSKIKTANCYPR